MCNSFKSIDAQNMTLTSIQKKTKQMSEKLEEDKSEYEVQIQNMKSQIEKVETEIFYLEDTLTKSEIEKELGKKDHNEKEMVLKRQLLESESIKIEIHELEQERLLKQEQGFQIENTILEEQKNKFKTEREIETLEREIEKLKRKGKQPSIREGQRN